MKEGGSEVYIAAVPAGGGKVQVDKVMQMGFEVSDGKKPLAAVWRIADQGNLVQFGPSAEHNKITNIKSGAVVPLEKKGGAYILRVDMRRKSEKGEWESCGVAEVTIDSAAEESVCPKAWAEGFPIKPLTGGPMNFRTASGAPMGHYGSRNVTFCSVFFRGQRELYAVWWELVSYKTEVL